MFADLVQAVNGVGPGQSLLAKVQGAQLGYGTGNMNGACGVLGGFVNEVGAQSGKKLSTEQAMTLVTDAETIRQAMSC
jgi:hypothetical protein